MKMLISLSILEYESDLAKYVNNLTSSKTLTRIVRLIQTGMIHCVHVDVMRPPMIPSTNKFSNDLIKRLYEELHEEIFLVVHLMVKEPFPIIKEINKFTLKEERVKITIVIQRESYSSEDKAVKALNLIKEYGYRSGMCLDLPTPIKILTKKIVENADLLLVMSVPMGRGGQRYSDEASRRISFLSGRYPDKIIEVDGGIDLQTIVIAAKAGAKGVVVGSFITKNENPEKAIQILFESLESSGLEES